MVKAVHEWIRATPGATNIVCRVGVKNSEGLPREQVELLRDAIWSAMRDAYPPGGIAERPRGHDGLQGPLVALIANAAGAPDREVPRWLMSTTPLGIVETIESGNVFPRTDALGRGAESDIGRALLEAVKGNYTSYRENMEPADALLQKEIDAGYVRWSADREVLERECGGELVPSRIGVVAKPKADGSMKYRLVHDLRRSGVNARIKLKERVVLPRLQDASEGALDLLEEM